MDERTQTPSGGVVALRSPRRDRSGAWRETPPGNGRRYRAGPAEAARAPLLVRIRIKHHLLQFLLGIARLFPHHVAGDVNRNILGGALYHDRRFIRKRRHRRDAAALHDVDELPVPLVRGHGVLDVLVETNNMRFPLLVDL